MFENETINITCGNCSRDTPKTIRWLKTHDRFTCSCGTVVTIDSRDLNAKISDIEKRFKNLFK